MNPTTTDEKDQARQAISQPEEQWVPVVGFDGDYEVSNRGRVLSWKPWHGAALPRIMRCPTGADGHTRVQLGLHGGTHRIDHLVNATFGEIDTARASATPLSHPVLCAFLGSLARGLESFEKYLTVNDVEHRRVTDGPLGLILVRFEDQDQNTWTAEFHKNGNFKQLAWT